MKKYICNWGKLSVNLYIYIYNDIYKCIAMLYFIMCLDSYYVHFLGELNFIEYDVSTIYTDIYIMYLKISV